MMGQHLEIDPRCTISAMKARFGRGARFRRAAHARSTTRLVEQHRLDGGSFLVGEFVADD
jgi:hypothetical protein